MQLSPFLTMFPLFRSPSALSLREPTELLRRGTHDAIDFVAIAIKRALHRFIEVVSYCVLLFGSFLSQFGQTKTYSKGTY